MAKGRLHAADSRRVGGQAKKLGHPSKLSDGRRAHLPHAGAPMHLDGDFADRKLPGDLFVKPSGRDEMNNLALPPAERLVPLAQYGDLADAGSARPVRGNRGGDRIQDILFS